MTRLQKIVSEILAQLFEQTELVEQMVQFGLESIEKRCEVAVEKVQQMERLVNQQEIEIEESCLRTLALHQPTASDLRMLATILKVNSDLERIADLAQNLTERAEALVAYPDVSVPPLLKEMVRYSLQMVKDAHQALLNRDVDLAHDVCKCDDHLDAMNREVIVKINESIRKDPDSVAGHLQFFSASRIVERIGDHATNIAEDVLYLVEGEIQRHQNKLPELLVEGQTLDYAQDHLLDS